MSALGTSGAGYTVKFEDKEYTFMPWSQGMMDTFVSWLVARLKTEAMDTAEILRRKARKLEREVKKMIDYGQDHTDTMSDKEKSDLQEKWEDMAGEMQSLQIEAREMVNRISERRAAGYYHFFGDLARQSRGQIDGTVKMGHLALLPKHPSLTLADVEAVARDNWDAFCEAIAEANESPKKSVSGDSTQTPETKTVVSGSPCTTEDQAVATSMS